MTPIVEATVCNACYSMKFTILECTKLIAVFMFTERNKNTKKYIFKFNKIQKKQRRKINSVIYRKRFWINLNAKAGHRSYLSCNGHCNLY